MTQATTNRIGVNCSRVDGAAAARLGHGEDACPHRANDPGYWNRAHRRMWLIGYREELQRREQ